MWEWIGRFNLGPMGILGPIVEILLISTFVYLLMTFMRGTRGAGVARGMLLVWGSGFVVLFTIAQWFGLDNVSWILENLVSVSLIAMVVIFQPEIRYGLVRIGETVRLWNAREYLLDKEIADAAVAIARRGDVGALIVVERETPVSAFIDSGIFLDAVCSSQLLRTVFTKNTPLHDGAVILRQGRAVAANCLLPLSENVEICRGMGTRHRAAIGLSEESDAVTVVVSEETGQISVTMDGTIYRDLDYERLRAFLREHCGNSAGSDAGTGV